MKNSVPHVPWDIAIVAADGAFPGAEDPEALWSLIAAGADAARETPARRWAPGHQDMLSPDGRADTAWSSVACLLDEFPALPEELAYLEPKLETLDPSYRLALSVGARVWAQAPKPSSFAE